MTELTPQPDKKKKGLTKRDFIQMMRDVVAKALGARETETTPLDKTMPPLAGETEGELKIEVKNIVQRGSAKTGDHGRAGKIPPAPGSE